MSSSSRGFRGALTMLLLLLLSAASIATGKDADGLPLLRYLRDDAAAEIGTHGATSTGANGKALRDGRIVVAPGDQTGNVGEEIISGRHPARKLDVCGVDDREAAVCYKDDPDHSTKYDKSKSVARIQVVNNDNTIESCTAWLASKDDHLITAAHCVEDASSIEAHFMAEDNACGKAPSVPTATVDLVKVQLSSTLLGPTFLDVAVLQVVPNSANYSNTYGYLEIDNREPNMNEEIYIPQHPNGSNKKLAIVSDQDQGGNCRVNKVNTDGCNTDNVGTMGYLCDTDDGSSGAPVVSSSTNNVLATHVCSDSGGSCTKNNPKNKGSKFSFICDQNLFGDLTSTLCGGGGGGGCGVEGDPCTSDGDCCSSCKGNGTCKAP